MAKQKQAESYKAQAEEIIRNEALKIARATQNQGQTKEQTKLIAKGIAKGISQYKKQQKSKLRERAKSEKKRKVERSYSNQQSSDKEFEVKQPSNPTPARLPGLISALIFLLVAASHLIRVLTDTAITIGTFSVPVSWSIPASVLALLLSIWVYRATRKD